MHPNRDQLRDVLASGLLAPSAENKHDLRFRVRADSVRLLATDHASWALQPHRQLLALLSFGAVVENIGLRSAQLGLDLTVSWLPDPGEPGVVADLRWTAMTAASDPLCLAIPGRHTNRRFFHRGRLDPATLGRLSAAAEAVPGASLLWLDEKAGRSMALTAIRLAETERFRRRELHRELFDAVRFETGWQRTTTEWLPPAALEVELPMRLPFALLRHWPLMHAAAWIGAHHMLGLRTGWLPCALAPHLGLIVATGQRDDLANLKAGRAFQRVWLAAAAEGLALQPMAAATALSVQTLGDGWVSAGVKARLQALLAAICGALDAQPYLLFRLGRAEAPSAVTQRRPVDDYIV
jgi:nitroreductase